MLKTLVTSLFILFVFQTALPAQYRVKTHESVEIGGLQQWVGAVGQDDSKPLLLFLHGGPGFSSRGYAKTFIRHLKKDFIVAQWDQRGTGITQSWNPAPDPITVAQMHQDTEAVVRYLLQKFNKEKLYLVGFSWGGFLGLHLADQHPELLHAYISVSGITHGHTSERANLKEMLARAQEENNELALSELATVQVPFTHWEQLYLLRKWSGHYASQKAPARPAPRSFFEDWSAQWLDVFVEAAAVNYPERVPELRCPVYFFLAEKDLTVNAGVSQAYAEALRAPHKEVVWFYESTHAIASDEPKKFSQALIKILQP
ncbi:MAG: alpha/beta hydrolase [Bacteroidota bacterium]